MEASLRACLIVRCRGLPRALTRGTGSVLPFLRADLRVCSSLRCRAYRLGLTLSPSRLTGLLISWEPGLRARSYPFSEQTYGSAHLFGAGLTGSGLPFLRADLRVCLVSLVPGPAPGFDPGDGPGYILQRQTYGSGFRSDRWAYGRSFHLCARLTGLDMDISVPSLQARSCTYNARLTGLVFQCGAGACPGLDPGYRLGLTP